MPTNKKYALCVDDGSFLDISESATHTGYKINVSSVTDIEKAKLYSSPSVPNLKVRNYLLLQCPSAKFVPVEETIERSVKLLGYGIDDENF